MSSENRTAKNSQDQTPGWPVELPVERSVALLEHHWRLHSLTNSFSSPPLHPSLQFHRHAAEVSPIRTGTHRWGHWDSRLTQDSSGIARASRLAFRPALRQHAALRLPQSFTPAISQRFASSDSARDGKIHQVIGAVVDGMRAPPRLEKLCRPRASADSPSQSSSPPTSSHRFSTPSKRRTADRS
jgi:hypothetical protein